MYLHGWEYFEFSKGKLFTFKKQDYEIRCRITIYSSIESIVYRKGIVVERFFGIKDAIEYCERKV